MMKMVRYALLTAMVVAAGSSEFALPVMSNAQNPPDTQPSTKKPAITVQVKPTQVVQPSAKMKLQPSVNFLSPEAGAKIDVGGTFQLRWKSLGVNSVTIDLILPEVKGKAPASYKPKVEMPVLSSGPVTGAAPWAVSDKFTRTEEFRGALGMPSRHPVNTDAVLRIRGAAGGGKIVEQTLPVRLIVPTVKVTSPGNGENYYSGLWHTVTWACSGARAGKVRVMIGQDGKSLGILPTWSTEANNTGTYRFQVPASAKVEGQAREGYFIGVEEVSEAALFDHPVRDWVKIKLY